jgi:hypothetical protein
MTRIHSIALATPDLGFLAGASAVAVGVATSPVA